MTTTDRMPAPDDEPLDPRLARLARELPRDIAPPADLWPAVRGRLAPRRRQWWREPWLQVAAALVAVAAITLAVTRHGGETPAPVAAAGATALDSVPGVEALAPETAAALRRNLAIIDSALAESRRVLAADPGNPDVETMLRLVERQRLELLRQVGRLPRS